MQRESPGGPCICNPLARFAHAMLQDAEYWQYVDDVFAELEDEEGEVDGNLFWFQKVTDVTRKKSSSKWMGRYARSPGQCELFLLKIPRRSSAPRRWSTAISFWCSTSESMPPPTRICCKALLTAVGQSRSAPTIARAWSCD